MIDWEAIKTEYVTGSDNLRSFAERYGITRQAVENRSRKEGWVAMRKAFRQEAVETAITEHVSVEAERLGKIITSAQKMADVLEGVFKDEKQFHRHIVTDTFIGEDGGKDILTVEKEFEKVDSRAIKDLTGALKDMTLVLRNLYNLPTQAEAEAQRIAAERLNMDKRKMEAESGTSKEIKVVLANGWEELAK